MTKVTWIIEDWMSQHVYRDMTFNSFEEARDFISDIADGIADETTTTEAEHEEVYDGICEDLYAMEVSDDRPR